MLIDRNHEYSEEFTKGKKIIHGRTIFSLPEIKEALKKRSSIIPLDNGCIIKDSDTENYGNLLCLNLKTFELTVQENIDF